jgi:hypothetical protein
VLWGRVLRIIRTSWNEAGVATELFHSAFVLDETVRYSFKMPLKFSQTEDSAILQMALEDIHKPVIAFRVAGI